MKLTDLIRNGLVLRRILTALEQQTPHLASIAASLSRIADQIAPEIATSTESDLKSTGISFTRDAEQSRILDFQNYMYRTFGRWPTDEEIVGHLDSGSAKEIS